MQGIICFINSKILIKPCQIEHQNWITRSNNDKKKIFDYFVIYNYHLIINILSPYAGSTEPDVKVRIALAWAAFVKVKRKPKQKTMKFGISDIENLKLIFSINNFKIF